MGAAGALAQNAPEPAEKGGGGDGGGQDVADRLGQKHREHPVVWHEPGQNQNQGDQQDQLAQTGQKQADLGLAQGHEALLAGGLEPAGKDAGHVDAHGPHRVVHQFRVGVENVYEQPGHGHHGQPEGPGVGHAHRELAAEGRPHPVGLARAEVVADQGLATLAHPLHGHGDELAGAGDDGHGAHGDVAAVAGQAGVEGDAEQAFGGHHHKGGHAQGQAGQDDPGADDHVFGAKAQAGAPAAQKQQQVLTDCAQVGRLTAAIRADQKAKPLALVEIHIVRHYICNILRKQCDVAQ